MPYWKRPEALWLNLTRYRELYPELPLEIIIVDDGSPEPAELNGLFPWKVMIVRLPDKAEAKNPCTAINAGVRWALGDLIVLTNPEVLHRTAILPAMQAELQRLGPKGYVAAACMGKDMWFCHSTDELPDEQCGRAKRPAGAGFHFCSMLRRELFYEVGGFSEEYRDGQGYEDNDFLWKLHAAGARFRIVDELVTDHYPTPRTEWPKGGAARNKALFEAKWNA